MPYLLQGEATAGFETSQRGHCAQCFEGTPEQAEDEGPRGGGNDHHGGGGEDQGRALLEAVPHTTRFSG